MRRVRHGSNRLQRYQAEAAQGQHYLAASSLAGFAAARQVRPGARESPGGTTPRPLNWEHSHVLGLQRYHCTFSRLRGPIAGGDQARRAQLTNQRFNMGGVRAFVQGVDAGDIQAL